MMMTKHATLALLLGIGGCATDPAVDNDPTIDDFNGGKSDDFATPRVTYCHTTDAAAALVRLRFTPNAGAFDIEASAGATFALASQRPALNVAVEDGASTAPREFVDFRPAGLDAVPPLGATRLELTLATGDKALTFVDGANQVQLVCRVSASRLLAYLGIAPVGDDEAAESATAVGFDIDDTLLFSTPTFGRAFATGGTPAPGDAVFWNQANRCDPGCAAETITLADGTAKQLPASVPSTVKARVRELVEYHAAHGAEVYAITARPDIQGDVLRAYLESELGIAADHVFFEPDLDQPGNPAGKTDRMTALHLDVFYGDSDSDITDAAKANCRGIRVLRSPKSSNRKDGRLNKYHPGYFGEPIIANSYD